MFYPDLSATSKVMTDLAVFLAEKGYRVSVLSQNRSYQDEKEIYPIKEEYNGVKIYRIPVPRTSKNSLVGRVALNLAFILKARKKIPKMGADILLTVSNPAFGSFFFQKAVKKVGIPSIYILHDLYPDILDRLKIMGERNPIYRIMRKNTAGTFREADKIIVLGEDVKEYIMSHYRVSASKIRFIPNWGPSGKIEKKKQQEDFPKEKEKLQVLYTGNIGATADLFTLVEAAIIIQKKDPSIHFRIVGGGRYFDALKKKVSKLGLVNLTIQTYLPEEKFLNALKEADIFFLSLKDGLEGISVPSKTYYYLSQGKPVICQVPENSEIAREVREWEFGMIAPADPEGLATILLEIRKNPEIRAEMARKAELAFLEKFSREKVLGKYESLLEEIFS